MAGDLRVNNVRPIAQEQSQLADMREEFEQQKTDLRKRHSQELGRLQEEYRGEELDLKDQNEATLSTIRKEAREAAEMARRKGTESVSLEEENYRKTYNDWRAKRGLAQSLGRTELENTKDEAKQAVVSENERRQALIEKADHEFKLAQRAQYERQQKAESTANQEVSEISDKHRKELGEIRDKLHSETAKEREHSEDQVNHLIRSSQETLEEARRREQARLKTYEAQRDKEFFKEKDVDARQYKEVRSASAEAVNRERARGQQSVQSLIEKQQSEYQNKRADYAHASENMQDQYSRETQRIQTEGESALHAKDAEFRRLSAEQQRSQKMEIAEQTNRFTTTQKDLNRQQAETLKEEVLRYREALAQAKRDFIERFQKAEESNRETLHGQRERFLHAMYEQNRQIDDVRSLQIDRASDPFYKLDGFTAKLSDKGDYYELHGHVPAHERERLEVRVKEDHAVIGLRRQHEERADEPGVKISRSASETWRQEFSFPERTNYNAAFTQVNVDGTFVVQVPKRA